MPEYLIHIGAHKTGTTYLQFVLQALRPALHEQGVLFPAHWSQSLDQPGHRKLFEALSTGAAEVLQRDFGVIEQSGATRVLISSEDLSYLQMPQIDRLRVLVGNNPTTIVFYCRRWSELLPSVWRERVKHGYAETLRQFLAAVTAQPGLVPFADFGQILHRYGRMFGHENLRLVSYSAVTDGGLDLAVHFLQTFLPGHYPTLPSEMALFGQRANVSPQPVESEVVRALNALHAAVGGERGPAIREWYERNRNALIFTDITRAMEGSLARVRLSDAVPNLARLHAELLAAFGDVLITPDTRMHLFDPRTVEIAFVSPDYLRERQVQLSLGQAYEAFRSGAELPVAAS